MSNQGTKRNSEFYTYSVSPDVIVSGLVSCHKSRNKRNSEILLVVLNIYSMATANIAVATIEDPDQPVGLCRLIRIYSTCILV
jgi:hypothetical protein